VAIAGLALLLQACGGGGGGGGSSAPPTYPVSGTVTGLASGTSVVLLDNGGDATTVAANGTFTFPTPLAAGTAYAVTVGTRPAHAHCAITNGSGTTGSAAPPAVAVTCAANPVNLFAYTANSAGEESVSTYTVDPSTGALTAVAGSPFLIGYSTAFAVNPAGTLVYSGTLLATHSIVTFPIDPATGAIGSTATTAVVLGANQAAQEIVFNAAGTMAYAGVVDTTSGFVETVVSFSVDATTGALTAVGGNPPLVPSSPSITLDPNGAFAYVTGDVTAPPIASYVSVYPLDPVTHALGARTVVFPAGGGAVTDYVNCVAVSPNGAYAYVLDGTTDLVDGYTINAGDGTLTAIAGYAPYHLLPQPMKMVFTPAGTLAVATATNNFLAKFTVGTDGSLSAVGANSDPLPTGANVLDLALDPTGMFAYTANSGTGNISGFVVGTGASGVMASTPGSPYASGRFPSRIAVRAARP